MTNVSLIFQGTCSYGSTGISTEGLWGTLGEGTNWWCGKYSQVSLTGYQVIQLTFVYRTVCLTECLTDWLIVCLPAWLNVWLNDQPTNPLTDPPNHWPSHLPPIRPTNLSTKWVSVGLSDSTQKIERKTFAAIQCDLKLEKNFLHGRTLHDSPFKIYKYTCKLQQAL